MGCNIERSFTNEQQLFRESYRKFLAEKIVPHMSQWKEDGIVDRVAFKEAGDQGFLMIWPDEKYGGLGDADFRYEQIIIEETTRSGCGSWYNSLHSRLVGPYIDHFSTEEQKRRILPECVSGNKILAIAMTEPGAGSDLSGMRTTLKDVGNHYVLNGSKTYISNGINADYIIVAAKTSPEAPLHDLTLVIVERGMRGFERGRNLHKMGLKAQDTAELFFTDVEIPKTNILGEVGKGFSYLMQGLAEERLIGAVGYSANARRAFDATREYVMERKLFRQTLADMQNTQFKMAEMDAELDMVQVYIDYCVTMLNQGKLTANMGAKVKLLSSESEWRMVDLGVQLHGGAGYMQEYPICEMFLDARVSRIYAGTSEIMKYIIGRDALSSKYISILD